MIDDDDRDRNDGLKEGNRRRDRGCRRGRGKNPALAERLGRTFLRSLWDRGPNTTDPLRAAVTLPPGQDPRIVGSALRPIIDAGVIHVVGRAKSNRPEAHGRSLDIWDIADRQAALVIMNAPEPPSTGEGVPA